MSDDDWTNTGFHMDRSVGYGHWKRTDIEPAKGKPRARVMLTLSGDLLKQYGGVIVMAWDHVVPKQERCGSKYRKWCEEFTEEERRQQRVWYKKFYGWELRTGYPEEVAIHIRTYNLIVRTANFFASI